MAHIVNRHALIIGVADYHHLSPLDGPEADASALAPRLRDRCGFTRCVTLDRLDHGGARLGAEIEDFLSPLGERDVALVYFAGHGLLDRDGVLRLMPDDARKASHGVSIKRLFEWSSKAALVIFVLDCCHAGAIPSAALTLGERGGRAVLCAAGAEGLATSIDGQGKLTAALVEALEVDAPTQWVAALQAAKVGCERRGQAAECLVRDAVEPFALIVDSTDPSEEPPPPTDPIEAWCALQRTLHAHLIPFFDDRDEAVLATRNVVQLDLCPALDGSDTGARGAVDGIAHLDEVGEAPFDDAPLTAHGRALGRSGPRVCTLGELMAQPRIQAEHANRWVILGDPGAGKSTLARHVTWSLSDPERAPDAATPVCLSLARLIRERVEPFELAERDLCAARGVAAARGLAKALRRRAERGDPVWLLLDGFDEVPEGEVDAAIARLKAWHSALPGVTLAVFSRPIGWAKELHVQFRPAEVKALRPAQQRALLEAWLGAGPGAAVWTRITARPSLVDLGRNPLMLTLLAMLSRDRAELPPTRSGLYDAAIDLLLRRGHCARPSRGVRSPTIARELLAALSLHLTEDGAPAWDEQHLVQALHDIRDADPKLDRRCARTWPGEVEAALSDIARNSGIIGPHDGAAERWRYLHRSLRERLAAEALAAQGADSVVERIGELGVKRSRDRQREAALDEEALGQWGETLGMACGLLPDAAEAVRGLRRVSHRLALRVLGEVDALTAKQALACLEEVEPGDGQRRRQRWNGDTIVAVVGGRAGAATALWDAVDRTDDLDRLAWLHYALTALEGAVDRPRFFGAIGRWPAPAIEPSDWVEIPDGTFVMGTPPEEANGLKESWDRDHARRNEVPHTVTLSRRYGLARCPVTVGEYQRFDPAHGRPGGPAHPVTAVTWWRARLYAAWLGCRLPTEAEWERACRARTDTKFWSGDSEGDLDGVGWYARNSGGRTRAVGAKPANPWGLHDMHGNVWEWCADWFAPYDEAPLVDPLGPATGVSRVLRGGSFGNSADLARSANRHRTRPGDRDHWVGFRLARSAPDLDLDQSGRALAGHLSDQ